MLVGKRKKEKRNNEISLCVFIRSWGGVKPIYEKKEVTAYPGLKHVFFFFSLLIILFVKNVYTFLVLQLNTEASFEQAFVNLFCKIPKKVPC